MTVKVRPYKRGGWKSTSCSRFQAGNRSASVARRPWDPRRPRSGGRSRTIPLAPRLHAALEEHRHLEGPLVLWSSRGTPPAAMTIRRWLLDVQQSAGLDFCGPHVLRHTFCSHLAMTGKPAKAIQVLAGHQSITTTERYMHLGPTATRDAIEGLRRPDDWRHAGDGRSSVIQLQ